MHQNEKNNKPEIKQIMWREASDVVYLQKKMNIIIKLGHVLWNKVISRVISNIKNCVKRIVQKFKVHWIFAPNIEPRNIDVGGTIKQIPWNMSDQNLPIFLFEHFYLKRTKS